MNARSASPLRRLPVALFAYVAWSAITLLSMRWRHPGEQSLLQSVSHEVGWNFVLAILFLAVLVRLFRWSDLAFVRPASFRSLKLLWFPALYLLGFAGLAAAAGVPLPAAQIAFVALNVALVGLSEEFMFRGVLFRALRSQWRTWPAILLTCGLFGGVHLFNVFITGHLLESAVQALAATLSGFIFMALLLRTGSLWVPIVYHALFDLGTFMSGAGADGNPPGTAPAAWITVVVPLALVLPNFLYALYLLRRVRNDPPAPFRM